MDDNKDWFETVIEYTATAIVCSFYSIVSFFAGIVSSLIGFASVVSLLFGFLFTAQSWSTTLIVGGFIGAIVAAGVKGLGIYCANKASETIGSEEQTPA